MIANRTEYEVSKAWVKTLEAELVELERGQPRIPEFLRTSRIEAGREVLHQIRRDIAVWESFISMDDQPNPIPRPELTPVWELVMTDVVQQAAALGISSRVLELVLVDMRERDQLGRTRYGTPLTAGNGRNHLVDAYQETLDATVYLKADIAEGRIDSQTAYALALHIALAIRGLLDRRGSK